MLNSLVLGIDEGVHRVHDDCRYAFILGFSEEPMKDGADVGERFTRASARGDDEVLARPPKRMASS